MATPRRYAPPPFILREQERQNEDILRLKEEAKELRRLFNLIKTADPGTLLNAIEIIEQATAARFQTGEDFLVWLKGNIKAREVQGVELDKLKAENKSFVKQIENGTTENLQLRSDLSIAESDRDYWKEKHMVLQKAMLDFVETMEAPIKLIRAVCK